MVNIFKQDARMGRLATALGPDILVLMRFEGTDRLNALFDYQVEALATASDLDFDALIGTHATVTLLSHDGSEQPYDGIITEARWLGVGENGHRYRLTLKPWAFLASLRRNQRIFHEQTVVDILTTLLGEYSDAGGLTNLLSGDYPVLEYTVQYRESDLDFATRLMERHGISYHFRHGDGTHQMVLTDGIESHVSIGARPYRAYDGHHQEPEEHFWEWAPARRITTGAIRLTDYNFKTPIAAMEVDRTGDATHAHGQIESYDYPGDFPAQGRGKTLAALRTDGERGQGARMGAVGDITALTAGCQVTLSGDNLPGLGADYLCLTATHSYVSDTYGTGGQDSDGYAYTGHYTLMPATAPLTPELKTPLARVQGPQTAVVVGDGEIDCDEYGRILVRFHWDLDAAHSMRCRVSQNWSGGGWGGMVIPRIGMEVVVEFIEGDPDKPLVTGCVFNGKNAAPYKLPDNKTRSVLRSDSHQANGFNEMTFEDKTGDENLFMHAQKDMTTRVLHDQIQRVDRHQVSSTGGHKMVEVGGNQKTEVAKAMNTVVGGSGMGALTLMVSMAGLAAKTGKLVKEGGKLAGGGGTTLLTFAATLGSSALGFLAGGGNEGRKGVTSGASNKGDAGDALRKSGTKLGDSGGGLFTLPGVMNTVVANFRSDTTGVAAVEQVGLTKVVNVGASAVESVGKIKKLTVGEDYDIETKKSIFARTVKHTLTAKEKFVIAGPGGSITIDNGGITIKARTLKIKSPSVDFSSGSPAQTDALKTKKPFAQECQASSTGKK